MTLWPLKLTFSPQRQRPVADQWAVLALGLAALILSFFLHPGNALLGTHTQLFLPPCSFYRLTRIPCATCGMTTSFALLAHGQFARAVLAHPFGVLIYPYLTALVGILGGATVLGRAVRITWRASVWQVVLFLGLVWAAKLLMWYFVAR